MARSLKIREKLMVLMLLVGLIPTLLVSAVAYIAVSHQLRSSTVNQLDSIATKQQQRIDTLLQSKREGVVRLSNRYELRVAVAQKEPAKSTTLPDILHTEKAALQDVQAIYVSDLQGKVYASTITGLAGKTVPVLSTLGASPSTTNAVAVREDPADKIDKLYMAAAVSGGAQSPALVTVVYGVGELAAITSDYTGLGSSGETVLASTAKGDAPVSLLPLRFAPAAALSTNVQSLQLGDDHTALFTATDYREKSVMVAARSVTVADWVVATKIDESEAFAAIYQLRYSLLFIFSGCLIAIAIVAFYFARIVTAPILLLTAKTRSIMQGDFRQSISVPSNDEIGTLADAFNTMTTQLATVYRGLEAKVKARTRLLNQKLAELENAKAKDDAILESIGDGMIVTDKEGRILLINKIALRLRDIRNRNVVGENITSYDLYDETGKLMPPEKRPAPVVLSTGRKVVRDAMVVQRDGTKVSIAITANPVLLQGKVVGSVQIIHDVTKAREVDRMKTEFISIASHQLRTPLSAINWFSEMMLAGDAGKLNKDQTEFAQNIADSTHRMTELVNSLLNISRIESGRIIIDPKPTDLSELVSGIVNDLKGKTAQKKQTLVVSVHRDLPKINLDPRLIGQVYLNLLTNAIKYTPEGGEISVFVSRDGSQVISQVSDTGYGIPKSEQAKMFQKFFRATNVAKVETDGTGLGMYLVKSIVETSGGKIWFESAENKGTTFWFSLPLTGMKAKEGEVTLDG